MSRLTLASILTLVTSWFGLGACTLEPPTTAAARPVRVLATAPEAGAVGVARDGLIHFWLSRPLDPGTLANDSIDVTSAGVRQPGLVHYDPVDRRLTYRPRGSLRRDLAYDAVLSEDIRGLREGEAVEAEPLTFETGDWRARPSTPPVPVFAEEIEPIFLGTCAFSGCHAGPGAAAGLDLSSRAAVRATAFGATVLGWPGWEVIDPGSAAYSYLVYKIMYEPSIRGGGMPPGEELQPEERRAIARWIDGGAEVDPGHVEP